MDTPCKHADFHGHLDAHPFEDTAEGASMLFALEIQVHCMACDAYLEFNLPQGIDLLGVTASEDKQTVRLSAQLGTPKPPIVRGFIVHHHSPGEVL